MKRKACSAVYATMCKDAGDECAVLYWMRSLPEDKPALVLLDWDRRQFVPQVFADADARLDAFRKDRLAGRGSLGTFVEEPNFAHIAKSRGYHARPIHEHLVAADAWDRLWASVAFYTREGAVGLTETAKSKPFSALSFKGGPRPDDDPTVPAWIYGIVLGLDEASGRPPQPSVVPLKAKSGSQR
jgi:hypothetical protein